MALMGTSASASAPIFQGRRLRGEFGVSGSYDLDVTLKGDAQVCLVLANVKYAANITQITGAPNANASQMRGA